MQRNMVGGGSLRQAFHFLQVIRSGEFNQFDYEDERTNMRMYGRKTPPAYNFTKITAPVSLYFSKDDDTGTMKDAIQLKSKLPNLKRFYRVRWEDFRHVDFGYSVFSREAINNKIVSDIDESNRLKLD